MTTECGPVKVAVVGATGAGKTALVEALLQHGRARSPVDGDEPSLPSGWTRPLPPSTSVTVHHTTLQVSLCLRVEDENTIRVRSHHDHLRPHLRCDSHAVVGVPCKACVFDVPGMIGAAATRRAAARADVLVVVVDAAAIADGVARGDDSGLRDAVLATVRHWTTAAFAPLPASTTAGTGAQDPAQVVQAEKPGKSPGHGWLRAIVRRFTAKDHHRSSRRCARDPAPHARCACELGDVAPATNDRAVPTVVVALNRTDIADLELPDLCTLQRNVAHALEQAPWLAAARTSCRVVTTSTRNDATVATLADAIAGASACALEGKSAVACNADVPLRHAPKQRGMAVPRDRRRTPSPPCRSDRSSGTSDRDASAPRAAVQKGFAVPMARRQLRGRGRACQRAADD